jgi:hypothetical protein
MFDPISAAIGAVGSLIGGSQQADAATSAAQTQANSANQANQLQYQMFQEQQALMQPWVQSGQQNLARLNYAMYGQLPQANALMSPSAGGPTTTPGTPGQTPAQTTPGGTISARFTEGMVDLPAFLSAQQLGDLGPTDRRAYYAAGGQMLQPGATAPSARTMGSAAQPGAATQTGGMTAEQMGVQGGSLNPDWRFSTQDWQNSPEYAVYNNARDAALTRSQDALMAQGAASGMYGSGTMANQLSQNMGQLYAQYDPLSLQTAQQNAVAARQNQYQMMTGMASPTGAQQVGQWAGNYANNVGQNMIGAGNAQAAGQVGAANAWGNALTSGVNQVSNAYGQYQGQQNFNQWMNQNPYQYQQPTQNQNWMQGMMSDFGG